MTKAISTLKTRRRPVLVPSDVLRTEDRGRTLASYRTDQKIFAQGNPSDSIFYVHSGKVKITVVSHRGKEAVIGIVGPDQFFGEGCLSGQQRRTSTARAMTNCVAMRIRKGAMADLIAMEPGFAEIVIDLVIMRTIRLEEDLTDQFFNSSERRLARALLMMASFAKDGSPLPVAEKITQETLAKLVGTTRSRISYFMNKFKKLGFIEYNGHLTINDSILSVLRVDDPLPGG